MHRSFLLLFLICLTLSAQAQVETYKTGIRHGDHYPYKLITSQGDQIRVESDGAGGGVISENGHRYFTQSGQGRKKDKFGFKEKHSQFLINEKGERLLTYYPKADRFLLPDESWIKVNKTDTGWTIEDMEGTHLASLNYETVLGKYWEFELTIIEKTEHSPLLKKYLFLIMPNWAKQREHNLFRLNGPLDVLVDIALTAN